MASFGRSCSTAANCGETSLQHSMDSAMALNWSKKLSERTCDVSDTQEAGSADVS
jgi:hypothetical protein